MASLPILLWRPKKARVARVQRESTLRPESDAFFRPPPLKKKVVVAMFVVSSSQFWDGSAATDPPGMADTGNVRRTLSVLRSRWASHSPASPICLAEELEPGLTVSRFCTELLLAQRYRRPAAGGEGGEGAPPPPPPLREEERPPEGACSPSARESAGGSS